MRKTTGWAVAAILAATGCGGAVGTPTSQPMLDEHDGPDAVCGGCKVTGGGQLRLGETRAQFAINAIPESGPAAGPGFGGEGVAAKGKLLLQAVPSGEGGPDLRGEVDTIVSCGRTDGVLTATVSGTTECDGRFTAVVTDGGEPEQDTIALTAPRSIGPVDVENGNIQVHELDRCEEPCPEGQCLWPESNTCAPCGEEVPLPEPPPPPPPPAPLPL